MIVVPAIDVRGGKVVRLKQGRVQDEQVYGSDPAEAARRWEAEGAERLHVVDLDAAMTGRPQFEAVAAVIGAVRIPVEVGGGLRTLGDALRYRARGADRVIFGTAALALPEVVQEAVQRWPGAVAVAIDARDGKVTVTGWADITSVSPLELARTVKAWGVPRIQYTDVVRDGMLKGANLAGVEELARETGLRITAAGGVASLDDLARLAGLEPLGVDEVVIGKALYEGRFTLSQAKESARCSPSA